jgi:hypothetical protein
MMRRITMIVLSLSVVSLLTLAGTASSAFAAEGLPEVPWWHLNVGSRPTHLAPGGEGTVVVYATNLGDNEVNGSAKPVTLTDELPKGVVATEAYYVEGGFFELEEHEHHIFFEECSVSLVSGASVVRCGFTGNLPPFERIEVRIKVNVEPEPAIVPGKYADTVSVSGGGTAPVSADDKSTELTVSKTPAPFGVERFELTPENADGSVDTQAGSHPFQVTTTTIFNAGAETEKEVQPALPRNLHFELPPGLIGNPTAFPECPDKLFYKSLCPVDTQLGAVQLTLFNPLPFSWMNTSPVYNLPPAHGEPARFGFMAITGREAESSTPVILDTAVRSGGDYGVIVSSDNITQLSQLLSAQLTFWGVPGDARHNRSRIEASANVYCLTEVVASVAGCPKDSVSAPFLALPTHCGDPASEPFAATLKSESWSSLGHPVQVGAPATYTLHDSTDPSLAMNGCEGLSFEPEIRVTPDGVAASSPTGVTVDVHVPQQAVLNPDGDAEAAVKDITVALPEGVVVNPSGGDGLQACSEGLVGYLPGESTPPGDLHFTPTGLLAEPFCPNAAKIGEVAIHTPLLPNPVNGFVYLATQNENPFGSLVAIYLVAEDPVSGTVVKLAGNVHLTDTGQLVTTFEDSPELPFEDAELHFFGGERAPLATPARCGSYTTSASFTPWSGIKPVGSTSSFPIKTGPSDSPCPGASLPFSPSLTGGTINNNGGAFSALSTTIGRADGQQNMSSVTLNMPPGLSGLLSGVELCSETQANAGTCGPGSLIGETTVSAGVGSDPVSVTGGKVYITEKYHGAPFGLSIVNPVKAGPFDLEHDTSNPAQNPPCDCIVVRAKVEVDPSTAALMVATNSEGEGYAIPHLIDGIPVQIKKVNVLINRPGFTFNPTSCDPLQITGSINSAEGASSPVSVPFQVANCAVLQFAPKFSVSTSGKTSKADGASLTAKVSEPNAPFGSQANIARVKVDLPKQLPSRLTTLQKACTAAQFETNPAGCPSASFIGHAVVHTPLIPVALEGPAIFVSHGGEAFPSIIMVLQGYGVTVDLVGTTFISKAGITSSTFKTVPDVPFSTFELTLPEGPYSALTANGNLCAATKTVTVKKKITIKHHGKNTKVTRKVKQTVSSTLEMPTEFIAQNGAELKQNTKIEVNGCPKAAKKTTKKHTKKTKKKK